MKPIKIGKVKITKLIDAKCKACGHFKSEHDSKRGICHVGWNTYEGKGDRMRPACQCVQFQEGG